MRTINAGSMFRCVCCEVNGAIEIEMTLSDCSAREADRQQSEMRKMVGYGIGGCGIIAGKHSNQCTLPEQKTVKAVTSFKMEVQEKKSSTRLKRVFRSF